MTEPMSFRIDLPPRFQKIKFGKFNPKDLDYPIHLYLRPNDVTVQEDGSDIINFLKGKHVLVTGATGFIGKMLVEKLLRSTKEITVYLIIREKRGKNIEERMDEMFSSYVFQKLLEIRPDFRKNIVGISGDISQSGLGLSEESRELLRNMVNIIYHAAASIRFDEELRKAVHTNILGTDEIIKLAKECHNFEVLTHISTAYSNSHLSKIEEVFYEPIVAADKLVTLIGLFPDDVLKKIAPTLLGGLPNTYTLTKQSSEDLISKGALDIPTCICRPSIVLSSEREPLRGWGDNLFGPIGYIVATALGLIHIQEGDSSNEADLVPADYVVNHCIAASYKTATDRSTNKISIYNLTSIENPITWKGLEKMVQPFVPGFGSCKSIMPYFLIYTENRILLKVLRILCHRVPASILDFAAVCTGRKPQLQKAYDKLDKFGDVLSYFSLNEFVFTNSNTNELWRSLNKVDQNNFHFDMKTLNWAEFFTVFLIAQKEYTLREFLDNLDESRAHFKRLKYGLRVILVALATLIFYIFYVISMWLFGN